MHPPLRRSGRPSRTALRGWVAASLAAVLLASQALGLWHRTVHAPLAGIGHEQVERHQHAQHAPAFGHDAGQTEQCRLYDQLTLADALLVASAALPVEAPRPACAFVATTTPALGATAPYEARAPPIKA